MSTFYRFGWGSAPNPLLPGSLRQFWADETVPAWFAADLGLSEDATYKALDHSVWDFVSALEHRPRQFLLRRITRSVPAIAHLIAVHRQWPDPLDPDDVPWTLRTFNAVRRGKLLGRLADLPSITFGELFESRGMGALGVLDFSCVLEATLNEYDPTSDSIQEMPPPAPATEWRVEESALSEWTNRPWTTLISRYDPRFRNVLPKTFGYNTIADVIESTLELAPLSGGSHSELLHVLQFVEAEVERIESQPLDEALEHYFLLLTRWKVARLRAFYRRLGWGPEYGETLESIGTSLGVSRERARQLEVKLVKSEATHPILMPALDKALTTLARMAPCKASVASSALQDATLTSQAFRPEGVINAASILGHVNSLAVVEDSGDFVLTSTESGEHLRQVRQIAELQVRASGASTALEVREELAATGIDLELEDVRDVLRTISHSRFVHDDWIISTRSNNNRTTSLARKMLSVAAPISAHTIREGIQREFRFRKTRGVGGWPLTVPPTNVIRAVLSLDPLFDVGSDGSVRPRRALDYRRELRPSERLVVEIIRSVSSGVIDRSSLLEEARRRGGNINTTSVVMTYSCVVQHLGIDLWSLRAAHLDPAVIEAARQANAQRPRMRRLLGYTWTTKGRLAVAFRVPPNTQGPVFGIPADVVRFVGGREFRGQSESGIHTGPVKVYDTGMCAGWAPFLRLVDAEEGDVLIVEFDLGRNVAVLRLESDEVFDSVDFEG